MSNQRKLFLVYFNKSNEFGIWDTLAPGSMQTFRNEDDLSEGLEEYCDYDLINGIPNNSKVPDYLYEILFGGAERIQDSIFEKIKR
jgi:hypothetical protein